MSCGSVASGMALSDLSTPDLKPHVRDQGKYTVYVYPSPIVQVRAGNALDLRLRMKIIWPWVH